MNDSADFRYQLSIKCGPGGQHMVNVRAADETEFAERLHWITSNAPEILAACTALSPAMPSEARSVQTQPSLPQTPPMASTPPQNANAGEMLVGLLSCEVKSGTSKTSGRAYTQYKLAFDNGMKPAVFDPLLGAIAQQNVGRRVYATVEKKGDYFNLTSIRPAA